LPAYPCVRCSNQVDIRDVTCRSCNEKKPFRCVKCDRQMGSFEIFDAESIKFQKPLYCDTCGRESKPVPCHHCKIDLVRRDAATFDPGSGERLYHPECLRTVLLQQKVSKGLMVFLIPFLAWIGYSYLGYYVHPYMGFVGAPLGGFLGWWLAGLMAPKK